MEPTGAVNISGVLFNMDNQLAHNGSIVDQLTDSRMVSDWNSIKGQTLKPGSPAYINQARLSTWYQDNGSVPILSFSNQFGLPVMGGKMTPVGQGARPDYPFQNLPKSGFSLYKNEYSPVDSPSEYNVPIKQENGIYTPNFASLKVRQVNGN